MRALLFFAAAIAVTLAAPVAEAASAAQAARARQCGLDPAAVARSVQLEPVLRSFPAQARFASRGRGGFQVIAFTDYSCPTCKAWVPQLRAMVQEAPDVRVEAVEHPIFGRTVVSTLTGNKTLQASRLALAALERGGPERYFRFHDALMADRGGVSEADIAKAAAVARLDLAALRRTAAGASVTAALERNLALVKALGANGTPVLIADGVFIAPTAQGRAHIACLLGGWRRAQRG